jgi:hypothetical protein
MTWADLFDRAAAHDVDETMIRRALEDRRAVGTEPAEDRS